MKLRNRINLADKDILQLLQNGNVLYYLGPKALTGNMIFKIAFKSTKNFDGSKNNSVYILTSTDVTGKSYTQHLAPYGVMALFNAHCYNNSRFQFKNK